MATLALFAFFTVGGFILGMGFSRRFPPPNNPSNPSDQSNFISVLKQ